MNATDVDRVRTLSRQYRDRAEQHAKAARETNDQEHGRISQSAERADNQMAASLDAVLDRALQAPETGQ